jgi:hypothetical protein
MEMTYHVQVERAERVKHIVEDIGIGQVIKEKYIGYGIGGQAGRYICITDTGITIIKTEDKLKVITMYVTTQRELVSVYGGQKKVPTFLRKKVDHNQSKYTQNGKTIWR